MSDKTDLDIYDEVINLGRCCEPVFAIRKLGLSKISYPFDWSVSMGKGIETLLKDNFESVNEIKAEKSYPISKNQLMYRFKNIDVWLPHLTDNTIDRLKIKISMFRNIMKTDKNILFIIKNHVYRDMKPDDALSLVNVIKAYSNTITFNLLIINEYKKEPVYMSYPKECIVKHIVSTEVIISDKNDDCGIVGCGLSDSDMDKYWKPIFKQF